MLTACDKIQTIFTGLCLSEQECTLYASDCRFYEFLSLHRGDMKEFLAYKIIQSLGPQGFVFQPWSFPFDIKTGTCSLTGKAQLLPFNERCSSSPCQQQCVTTTGRRHLGSLRGASAVKQNLQSCHFTLTDEPTWTGQETGAT